MKFMFWKSNFHTKDSTIRVRSAHKLISRPAQSGIAIHEQPKRILLDSSVARLHINPLGKLLMKFDFIDRLQCKCGLMWHRRLRDAALAITLATPVMMFAPNAAHASPIRVEAENYSTMFGVVKENTTDVGRGKNLGAISTGDWMVYVIDVPENGVYKIVYRVASPHTHAHLVLRSGSDVGLTPVINVPNTGGWQVWRDIAQTVSLKKGKQTLKIYAQTGGFNLNRFEIEQIGTNLPLTIEADNYSAMSGVHNEVTTDVGGGKNVGYIHAGDWMDYKNVAVLIPTTARYKITYRVASLNAGGRFTFHQAGSSTIFDTVSVPITGGWQKWTSVTRIVTLPTGKHYFGIKALLGGFNINWIRVEAIDQPPAVAPSLVTSASSSSVRALSASVSSKSAVRSSSRSSSSVANSVVVAGPVEISWTAPNKRENGDYLDISDIGGYEIRYKKISDSTYTYIAINDAFEDRYSFSYLVGNYVFQIAAFDKNGVYSSFVDIRKN